MKVIQVDAGPHDPEKFFKGPPTFRHAGLVRRQVARDDVGRGRRAHLTEILAATQIGRWVDREIELYLRPRSRRVTW